MAPSSGRSTIPDITVQTVGSGGGGGGGEQNSNTNALLNGKLNSLYSETNDENKFSYLQRITSSGKHLSFISLLTYSFSNHSLSLFSHLLMSQTIDRMSVSSAAASFLHSINTDSFIDNSCNEINV